MLKELSLPLFFILTGGPGSGKSSLVSELKKQGYEVIEESGRKIIQEQVEKKGEALPWKNKEKFRDLMIERDMEKYKKALKNQGPIFFDRGIPDSLGYSELEGLTVTESLLERVRFYPYQPLIFILSPWKEIYENDAERKQDFELASKTYDAIKKVYTKFKYRVLEVPKGTLEERVDFVQGQLKNLSL